MEKNAFPSMAFYGISFANDNKICYCVKPFPVISVKKTEQDNKTG